MLPKDIFALDFLSGAYDSARSAIKLATPYIIAGSFTVLVCCCLYTCCGCYQDADEPDLIYISPLSDEHIFPHTPESSPSVSYTSGADRYDFWYHHRYHPGESLRTYNEYYNPVPSPFFNPDASFLSHNPFPRQNGR